MKNTIIKVNEENIWVFIQYLITSWKSDISLNSMNNPETLEEAIDTVKQIIMWSNKFKKYIPIDDEKLLMKLIYKSLNRNESILETMWKYIIKNSSKIAGARVDTIMALTEVCNGSYQPISDSNYL